jgi:hypothetical protein
MFIYIAFSLISSLIKSLLKKISNESIQYSYALIDHISSIVYILFISINHYNEIYHLTIKELFNKIF